MRKKYRSHVGVIADVLEVIYLEDGASVTKIMYSANLPYDRLKNILTKLEERGFIKIEKGENETSVFITEKGLKLLDELKWIKNVFKNLGFKL